MLGSMMCYDSFITPFWVLLNDRVSDCAKGNYYCSRYVMKQRFPVFCCLLAILFLRAHINYLYNRMLLYFLKLVVMMPDGLEVTFSLLKLLNLVQARASGTVYLWSSHRTKPKVIYSVRNRSNLNGETFAVLVLYINSKALEWWLHLKDNMKWWPTKSCALIFCEARMVWGVNMASISFRQTRWKIAK